MTLTIEQYRELPELRMPLRLKEGFTITQLTGFCTKCTKHVAGHRGNVTERPNCSDVMFAGICQDCNILHTFHFRYYHGGKCIQHYNGGWEDMPVTRVNQGWWSRLKRIIRELTCSPNRK